MTDPKKQPVTVLGLGAMGTALAEALLAAGHPTTVWNRTPAKAEPLAAKGAASAATVADAVTASPLVVACLLDHHSVDDVLGAVAGDLAGRTLVNLTNGTPGQARRLATWAVDHEIAYVDGGIMAVPPMIGTPSAFVVYSGDQAAFDAARPALEVFGDAQYVGTDPGHAALYDVALLTGMYGNIVGLLQAYAMVTAAGVEVRSFEPLLSRWLEALQGTGTRMAEQVDTGDYLTGVVSNLAMQSTGFVNLLLTADELGVSPELFVPFRTLLERRAAAGHGDEDATGVVELLRPRTTTAEESR